MLPARARAGNTGAAILFVCLVLLAVGCGGAPSQTPAAAAEPAVTPTPVEYLALSSASVDFGQVTVGTSSTRSITVNNTGTAAGTINSASLTGSGFNLAATAFPMTVHPGAGVTLQVTFSPASAGSAAGTLTLSTSKPASLSVALTGSGVSAPTVEHSASLNWGPSPSLVDGYFIYRSSQPGGPFVRMNALPLLSTSYSDSSVVSGATYYYVVTSVLGTVESSYSNEAVAVIPAP